MGSTRGSVGEMLDFRFTNEDGRTVEKSGFESKIHSSFLQWNVNHVTKDRAQDIFKMLNYKYDVSSNEFHTTNRFCVWSLPSDCRTLVHCQYPETSSQGLTTKRSIVLLPGKPG